MCHWWLWNVRHANCAPWWRAVVCVCVRRFYFFDCGVSPSPHRWTDSGAGSSTTTITLSAVLDIMRGVVLPSGGPNNGSSAMASPTVVAPLPPNRTTADMAAKTLSAYAACAPLWVAVDNSTLVELSATASGRALAAGGPTPALLWK